MSHRVVPLFLATAVSKEQEDRPLVEEEIAPTWEFISSDVKRFAFDFGSPERDVEDLVQDVAIVFIARVRAGKVRAAVPVIRKFLRTTTWKMMSDRRKKSRPVLADPERLVVAATCSPATDPDRVVSCRELLAKLETKARTELPSRSWEILLAGVSGVTDKEMAQRLELPDASVRLLRFRARRQLEDLPEFQGDGGEAA